MHYMEGSFDSALGKIVHYLVPDHQYKSVHDYFNPTLFHSTLLSILANIPHLASHLDSLTSIAAIQEVESVGSPVGFREVRIRNFTAIWKAMEKALSYQGLEATRQMPKEKLFRMVKEYDLDLLEIFLQHLFELLINHHGAVEHITELPAEDQTAIKDFLQRAKNKADHHRTESAAKQEEEDEKKLLEEANSQLRELLNSKESDMQRLTIQNQELEDQIQELNELEKLKGGEIEALKKRLLAYEETDTLFQQKDEDIFKLNKALSQLQLANCLTAAELTNQKTKQEERINSLQQTNIDLQARVDKLSVSFDTISKQKEEIEQSNKKVIANLKDKIKSLTERVGELQGQLVEAKIHRELRERQFSQLWANYESLRCQPLTNPGKIGGPVLNSSGQLERFSMNSSGHHKQFLRLGEEINELDKFHQNAFEEEIMLFDNGEDSLKKVQEIINENAKLKERIGAIESKDYRTINQENDKLKKKLAVMRKRNEDLQNQRRDQLDLMVSAFEHCLRGKLQP